MEIQDAVTNTSEKEQPVELLYHMNMGYPLMDEDSQVEIPADSVTARDAHAASGLADCLKMELPQPDYQEMCFYYRFSGEVGEASIYQPKHRKGLTIRFDTEQMDCFTQWKMMGVRDYVLGLEPGNCYPDGRDIMREKGILKFLQPGETGHYGVRIQFFEK